MFLCRPCRVGQDAVKSRSLVAAALVTALVPLAPSPALAGPDEACASAANESEVLRHDVTKLTKARDKLRVCAANECPSAVREQCRKALDELESTVPTVVFTAEDERGGALFEIRVAMDGVPIAERLDGSPFAVDAGAHTFTFTRDAAAPIEVKAVVQPRQKNIEVRATFSKAGAAPAPPTAEPDRTPSSSKRVLPIVGLVVAGAGVVGLGLGTFFGLTAAQKQSDAHCPDNKCTQPNSDREALVDAKDAGNLSTAFFIAGGVLTAGGLAIFFLSPRAGSKSARLRPSFGSNGASVVLEGVTF